MAEVAVQGGVIKALAIASAAKTRFVSLPAKRRNWLIGAAVGMLALVLGMAWYSGRPDWRVLFSGLESKDVTLVSQELAAAGIAFETTADGTGVEVPAELLDKARMEVAAKGMPQTGRLGFELFDKPNWVGSEFDERVNYQRALEGELEHTIATLGVVRSARVHLVLPQASLFTSEQKAAKASVVIRLKRASLPVEETDSIRNLVAGAVENLTPEQVTLVDADGRVNLEARRSGAAQGDAEQALESKLVAMLEPLAGAGNVRATVNVSYEQGTEERTDEVFDPTQSAALSIQKTEQVSSGPRTAQGVPGTASNTPAAAPAGAVQGSAAAAVPGVPPLLQKEALPVYPQGGAGGQSVKEESGTYAVTRHLVHTANGPGRIRRVTAAIVVNDRMVSDTTGRAAWKPRTAEELKRLEGLAQAAVGFDEKRGDQVVMENVSFSANVAEVKVTGLEKVVLEAKSLMSSQPGLLRNLLLSGVGLMMVLFVLRPVAGQVVATLREPLMLAPRTSVDGPDLGMAQLETAVMRTAPQDKDALPAATEAVMRPRLRHENAIFEQVSEHIRQQPELSTRLLETWIGEQQEGE